MTKTLLSHWRTLVDHTDEHFAREVQWMQAQAGDLGTMRQMARELAL